MVRAVTISLLSVLSLCPAAILAAKECKGLFHFDLSDKVDNRETFSHRRATSLEECVRICYSKSDFCFSALFIPSPTGSHQCLLSYQTAYMCSKRQLSTVHKLSDKPVIVECIRCTALGDKGELSLTFVSQSQKETHCLCPTVNSSLQANWFPANSTL
ncbi:hypothetical protein D918_00792 [Trichuris suis]|nr:hypothetical protein D918_00792 [Trichuris suis]